MKPLVVNGQYLRQCKNWTMARDEFSSRVLKSLSARVAHRCSNPGCEVPTTAPGTGSDGITNIGIGAHIHAAAAGGPRYLAEMTKGDRTSINNAIWLCAGCATKVDRDVERYPAELLREWKAKAEARATRELGRPQPKASDAVDQLATALTGLPTSFAPGAIQNVHTASRSLLEKIDPRFRIETAYQDNKTTIALHPKETVPMSFRISKEFASAWKTKLAAMFDHGMPAELNSEGVELCGSPLFENAIKSGGKIHLIPHGKKAVIKASLVEQTTQQVVRLDDVHGELVGGRVSLTCTGSGMGGLLEMSVQKQMSLSSDSADFSIQLNLERWVDTDVRALPYFEQISQLYGRVMDGWRIDLRIEFEGTQIFGGLATLPIDNPLLKATKNILDYTRRARIVSTGLGQPVEFRLSPPFSAEDHVAVAEIADIIQGKHNVDRDGLFSNIRCTLVVDESGANLELLRASSAPQVVHLEQPPTGPMVVFGQPITLPALSTTLNNVLPKIVEVSTSEDGERTMLVEWIPTQGFTLKREYS